MSQYNGKTDVGEIWAAVRRLTGRQQSVARVAGLPQRRSTSIMPESRQIHNTSHQTRSSRQMTDEDSMLLQCVSEWQVLRALDTLQHTAAGLDGLPAWFLRVAVPVFCKPIAYIFNLSLQTSTVPQQWKEARIRPVPKVTVPVQLTDFRLISVTPILTR